MFIILAICGVIFMWGFVYLICIIIFASKVKKNNPSSDIELMSVKLEDVDNIDLQFVEEISQVFQKDYTWLGDYEVKGLKGKPLMVLQSDDQEMQYCARYFIDEINGILITICCCNMTQKENWKSDRVTQQYMTAFYLESIFQDDGYIVTSLMSRKQFEGQILQERLMNEIDKYPLYKSLQDISALMEEHEAKVRPLKEDVGINTIFLKGELKDILSYKNKQAYRNDRKNFRYMRRRQRYIPTLTYAIKCVLERPFFSLFINN